MTVSFIAWIDGSEGCEGNSVLGYWGLIFWFSLSIYIFIGLYVLCDRFFVPSLTILGEKLGLSEDVCGATLMAAGSSSPEFFTAIIGVIVFPTENPGPSTNCASAVFNMCIIIGLSVIFCGKESLELRNFPFMRDCIFYGCSAFCLYLFYEVITPGFIQLWESVTLVSLWFSYVIVLYYDLQIRKCILYLLKLCGLINENIEDAIMHTYQVLPQSKEYYANSHYKNMEIENTDYIEYSYNASNYIDDNKHNYDYDDDTNERSPLKTNKHTPIRNDNIGINNHYSISNGSNVSVESDSSEFNYNDIGSRHDKSRDNSDVSLSSDNDNDNDSQFSGDGNNTQQNNINTHEEITAMVNTYYPHTAIHHHNNSDNSNNNNKHKMTVNPIPLEVESSFDEYSNDDNNDNIDDEDNDMVYGRTNLQPTIVKSLGGRTATTGTTGTNGTETITDDNLNISINTDNLNNISNIPGYCNILKTSFLIFFKFVIIPFEFIFNKTIPNANPEDHINNENNNIINNRINNCKLLITFIISILWMAILTWLVVDMSTKIGACLLIHPDVMGLTLLAIGSSLPDLFSSILVAKQGKAGMAVSNAIGSNVFDICICVGVSFLLKSLFISNGEPIEVGETNLGYQSFIIALFVLLGIFMALMYFSNLIIYKYHGWLLIGAYIIFIVVFSIVLEDEPVGTD